MSRTAPFSRVARPSAPSGDPHFARGSIKKGRVEKLLDRLNTPAQRRLTKVDALRGSRETALLSKCDDMFKLT